MLKKLLSSIIFVSSAYGADLACADAMSAVTSRVSLETAIASDAGRIAQTLYTIQSALNDSAVDSTDLHNAILELSKLSQINHLTLKGVGSIDNFMVYAKFDLNIPEIENVVKTHDLKILAPLARMLSESTLSNSVIY